MKEVLCMHIKFYKKNKIIIKHNDILKNFE